MNCLKCGAQVQPPEVFCSDCQADMARHPVPQDTVVVLPSEAQTRREPRKAYSSNHADEELAALRHQLAHQRALIWIMTLTLALMAGLIVFLCWDLIKSGPVIGQNYQTPTTPSTAVWFREVLTF